MEAPPILPDIEEQLRDYLICVERLPIHEFERNQQFWPREPNPQSLFNYENSPLSTTLKVSDRGWRWLFINKCGQVQRDLSTGEILRFEEVSVRNPDVEVYSKSLHGPRVDSIAGTQLVSNCFWGDGIPEVRLPEQTAENNDSDDG